MLFDDGPEARWIDSPELLVWLELARGCSLPLLWLWLRPGRGGCRWGGDEGTAWVLSRSAGGGLDVVSELGDISRLRFFPVSTGARDCSGCIRIQNAG